MQIPKARTTKIRTMTKTALPTATQAMGRAVSDDQEKEARMKALVKMIVKKNH